MKHLPVLATVMSPFPYSIDVNAPLTKAIIMMTDHGFHHLPVTEEGNVVGVLSEKDIRYVESPFSTASMEDELFVKDVFTSRSWVVDIHEPLEKVLFAMAERHIGAVVVMKNDKLAGIVTHNDVFKKFAELLARLKSKPDGNDAA